MAASLLVPLLPLVASAPAAATVTVTSHFVWTPTGSAVSGNSGYILNGATNDLPKDLVFVAPNYDANGLCGCVTDTSDVAVWYSTYNNEWGVLNEDGALMGTDESFNVLVVPKASAAAFLQTASSSNIEGDATLISSKLTNGVPSAQLQVTQDFDPGGKGGVYNAHPIGVRYLVAKKRWAIYNEDGAPMTDHASFNVLVGAAASNGGATSVLTSSASNAAGDTVVITNAETTGNPNNVTFVTPTFNPHGKGGANDTVQPGVWYTGAKEGVFNESGQVMALHESFDVLVFSS